MSTDPHILNSLGLSQLLDPGNFRSAAGGTVVDAAEVRAVVATAEAMRSLRKVVDGERAGSWQVVMKASGYSCGRKISAQLDRKLAALGKPALAALPLEACLVFIEHLFATHGWGRLTLDLGYAAEHGLVIARLEQSYFAESLPDELQLADAFPAGVLRGFFEHISGQTLDCEEIACAGTTGPAAASDATCIFVITAPECLSPMRSRLGIDSADALIATLIG